MKTKSFYYWVVAVLGLVMLTALGACNGNGPQTLETLSVDDDWRDDVIYFAMTDRFANGDPSNDDGAERGCVVRGGAEVCYYDEADVNNPVAWHGGDFAGLTEKLNEGYFTDLGVTAIWISPVVLQAPGIVVDSSSPNAGLGFGGFHGYWAEDFKQVDPHFGTLDEYKELVEVAHENDIKIIQDMVLNHSGYDAPLVFDRPEWFNDTADCGAAPPQLTDIRCALVGLPDFDQRQAEVVAFLNEVTSYWVDEVGIDGIRMDTIKHVEDSYWQQFFGAGDPADTSEVWTVGEGFYGRGNAAQALSRYLNDLDFPSVFDFQLHWGLNDALSSAEGSLETLAQVFDRDSLYDDPSRLTTFVDNHDVPRFVTVAIEEGGVSEAEARERLELALGVIFTSRGTPSFYYGTEIAMQGKGDNYSYVLGEGNREDMRFDEVAGSGTADWLKTLADARQANRALTDGTQRILVRPSDIGANVMAYSRTLEGEAPVVVVINNQNEALELDTLNAGALPLAGTFAAGSTLTELLGQETNLSVNAEGNLTGTLPARSLLALSAETGQAGTTVTFRVDARSQGEAQLELRRFDTGTEVVYPLTPTDQAGFWETTLELTPGTELSYKFGNSASAAKGDGYEGAGQDDRSYTVTEDAATVEATYGFIDLPAPESSVLGTVTDSEGEAIAGATVVAQELDASTYYALTNPDGSYYLPLPAGESSAFNASADGFASSEPVTATAGDTGVDFILQEDASNTEATLQSPGEGDFGTGNNFQQLDVTWDDADLTVQATFTANDNSGIVYMDYQPGGINNASGLNAWPRLATFPNNGIDAFFARFSGDPAAKAYLIVEGNAREIEVEQTVSDGDSLIVTLTFPWETLGFEGKPAGSSIDFFAGVFGGDNYGAGDIAPDNSSAPSANNSTTGADPFPATFNEPFRVTVD